MEVKTFEINDRKLFDAIHYIFHGDKELAAACYEWTFNDEFRFKYIEKIEKKMTIEEAIKIA